eukprot:scaffold131368_cov63-Phaeocystis_antarctica.AAC.4
MRRFRCNGSQFGHAINLPKGLGSRIENVLFARNARPRERTARLGRLMKALFGNFALSGMEPALEAVSGRCQPVKARTAKQGRLMVAM